VRAQVSKLIIAGEMVIISKRMGKKSSFFLWISISDSLESSKLISWVF